MARSEAAYLSKQDAVVKPSDSAMPSTAQQNLTAAQSTITDPDVAAQHRSFLEILIYNRPPDGQRASWGWDA